MNEKISVIICICTFRRAHVMETLRSVFKLNIEPKWDVKIIVADNDETDSARQNVAIVAKESNIPIDYIHAPSCNISIARNACLDAATTPLIAFIDDDELVTDNWLKAMLEKLASSGADVVLGPVNAIYSPECSGWIRKGDFLSTYPVWVGEEIITGYAGNVLIKRISPAIHGIKFRKDLGKTGGEDSAYFSNIYKQGGVIVFAPEAQATEVATPAREKLCWLLKRRFRVGQTHGLLLMENHGNNINAHIYTMRDFLSVIPAKAGISLSDSASVEKDSRLRGNDKTRSKYFTKKIAACIHIYNIAKAFAKLVFCLVMALANFIRPVKMRFWLLRGALHAGVIARLLGKREIIQYG